LALCHAKLMSMNLQQLLHLTVPDTPGDYPFTWSDIATLHSQTPTGAEVDAQT
jgi:hypothetical protein